MRIAQVAPLFENVPPQRYGGTERVVAYLTEELVAQGHDVTLFASGDSRTRARLVSPCPRALRLGLGVDEADALPFHILQLEQVFSLAEHFDVLHFHTEPLHLPLCRRQPVRHLTTLHGRLDQAGLEHLFHAFQDMPLVSISDAQRAPLPEALWAGTVYHGLPESLYTLAPEPGRYLAFLGRLSPEKGPDRAVAIARRVGLPLRIAAKVGPRDEAWFQRHMAPLLEGPGVEFIGEIREEAKSAFLGGAQALLFPIGWPEPFGLAMIEAMACGTPVVAFDCGSVREIVEDGLTGFVVGSVEEAVVACKRAARLDRWACRERFLQRFSARRMARDYVALYTRLLAWRERREEAR